MRTDEHDEHGFSLVETLVVVFIVGLVASLVVAAMPAQPKGAEADARALRTALLVAEDASLTTGLPHGLVLSEAGWSVVRYVQGAWVSPAQSGPAWRGQFASGVECRQQEEATRKADRRDEEKEPAIVPVAWFDPLGQSVIADLSCSDPRRTVSLRKDEAGGLIVLSDEGGS